MSDEVKSVVLSVEERVFAVLKLLCDHAGIDDSAVQAHLDRIAAEKAEALSQGVDPQSGGSGEAS